MQAARVFTRALSTSVRRPATMKEPLGQATGGMVPADSGYAKVRSLQNVMTEHDGKMVWQKLSRDTFGYQVSMAFTVFCTGLVVYTIGKMTLGKK